MKPIYSLSSQFGVATELKMSCSYAEGLSEYHDKGKLGLPEKFDNQNEIDKKVELLAEWISKSKHIVVHTGAGISTSAGIPDFRGPKGVWTLEKRGEKPEMNVSWDEAKPTKTHMALAKLVEVGKVKFIVSQNIDGLHLRSGVPRTCIAELHGNMFVDQCDNRACYKMFVRDSPAPTVGQKYVGGDCPATRHNGRNCRGKLKDFVLDWEAELPDSDLSLSDTHSMMADLSIVMGSTLQIIPAGNLPTYAKKYQEGGKLVICNLQPTKQDKKADLSIHTYVDDVMEKVMKILGFEIPEYDKNLDPVRLVSLRQYPGDELYIDWTQNEENARDLKKIGDLIHEEYLKKRREEKKKKRSLEIIEKDEIKTNKLQKKTESEVNDLTNDITGAKNGDANSLTNEVKEEKLEILTNEVENGIHNDTYISNSKEENCNNENEVKENTVNTTVSENGNGVTVRTDNEKEAKELGLMCRSEENVKKEGEVSVTEEFHGFRSCKKTDSYQFDTEEDFTTKTIHTEPTYIPSNRNCKKKDSYEFGDDDCS